MKLDDAKGKFGRPKRSSKSAPADLAFRSEDRVITRNAKLTVMLDGEPVEIDLKSLSELDEKALAKGITAGTDDASAPISRLGHFVGEGMPPLIHDGDTFQVDKAETWVAEKQLKAKFILKLVAAARLKPFMIVNWISSDWCIDRVSSTTSLAGTSLTEVYAHRPMDLGWEDAYVPASGGIGLGARTLLSGGISVGPADRTVKVGSAGELASLRGTARVFTKADAEDIFREAMRPIYSRFESRELTPAVIEELKHHVRAVMDELVREGKLPVTMSPPEVDVRIDKDLVAHIDITWPELDGVEATFGARKHGAMILEDHRRPCHDKSPHHGVIGWKWPEHDVWTIAHLAGWEKMPEGGWIALEICSKHGRILPEPNMRWQVEPAQALIMLDRPGVSGYEPEFCEGYLKLDAGLVYFVPATSIRRDPEKELHKHIDRLVAEADIGKAESKAALEKLHKLIGRASGITGAKPSSVVCHCEHEATIEWYFEDSPHLWRVALESYEFDVEERCFTFKRCPACPITSSHGPVSSHFQRRIYAGDEYPKAKLVDKSGASRVGWLMPIEIGEIAFYEAKIEWAPPPGPKMVVLSTPFDERTATERLTRDDDPRTDEEIAESFPLALATATHSELLASAKRCTREHSAEIEWSDRHPKTGKTRIHTIPCSSHKIRGPRITEFRPCGCTKKRDLPPSDIHPDATMQIARGNKYAGHLHFNPDRNQWQLRRGDYSTDCYHEARITWGPPPTVVYLRSPKIIGIDDHDRHRLELDPCPVCHQADKLPRFSKASPSVAATLDIFKDTESTKVVLRKAGELVWTDDSGYPVMQIKKEDPFEEEPSPGTDWLL